MSPEINPNPATEAFNLMKALFPEGEVQGTIAPEQQKIVLDKFSQVVDYHTFYFVIDVSTQRIIYAKGVEKYLLYSSFELADYFKSIPSYLLRMMNEMARQTFQTANNDPTLSEFMSVGLTVDMPLQRVDGSYVLVQRTLYVFDICPKGRVKSYLNVFTVLRELESVEDFRTLSPRVKTDRNKELKKLEKILLDAIKKGFQIDFTRAEREVLHETKLKRNNKEIAVQLGVSENTVKTLKARALKRAKKFFNYSNLSTAEDLVNFLDENKISF